jgi:hypothetical protein
MAKPTGKTFIRPTKNAGSGQVGERVGGPPADEGQHYHVCPECGQAVDWRDFGRLFHHATPGHERLPES